MLNKATAALALLCVALGAGLGWTVNGWRMGIETQRLQAARETDRANHARALAAATDHARTVEADARRQVDIIANQLTEVRAHAEHVESERLAAVRRGDLRLSVATTGCGVRTAAADPATATPDPEARADIDPGVAAALVDIAQRGDRGIIELNACIDAYNRVRNAFHPAPDR